MKNDSIISEIVPMKQRNESLTIRIIRAGMNKIHTVVICLFLLINLTPAYSQKDDFDPSEDGWYFKNFSTSSDKLTYDLFQRTYLGVNPNKYADPLDASFYEVFKVSSNKGNCGGMALLALALYKYGGYMGYCSPPCFYRGDLGTSGKKAKGPDNKDLYKVINIMQARQFSSKGISNILDLGDSGNINNAEMAFKQVKEALARGDYPLLVIADNAVGNRAHTIIAYKVEEYTTGTYRKRIFVWDSNYPFNNDTTFYDESNPRNIVKIDDIYVWKYEPNPKDASKSYICDKFDAAWCYCQPMSNILVKSRHPFNLDVIQSEIKSLVVTGSAGSVSQISDNEGHAYFKPGTNNLETDPNKKLKGVIKWPWFDQRTAGSGADTGDAPPELYFMRGSTGQKSGLNIAVRGQKYEAVFVVAQNMIRINCDAASKANDVFSLADVATATQSLTILTTGKQRNFQVNQLRVDRTANEWRSIDVKNLKVSEEVPVQINVLDNFEEVSVASREKTVNFDLDIQQFREGKVTTRNVGKLSTTPGQLLRIQPENWKKLEHTQIKKDLQRQILVK